MNFSVLMSVYRNDKPEDFRVAVESISIKQSVKPNEIIIVVDGHVPEKLEETIKSLSSEIPTIKVLWQEKNQGLGMALQIGMEAVTNEIVARMDADDISVPDRFEKQLAFMTNNPSVAVCGGQISEFIDSPDNIVGYRKVPLGIDNCKHYFQDRDPLNHMTVMFLKTAVMSVGNYQPWHLDEDTYLWGRLLENGYQIDNLDDVLVKVRVGSQMYARRGGWKYFRSDIKILRWKLKHGLSTRKRYLYNYAVRFCVYVLMPNALRGWVFKNLLRSK